MTYTLILYLCWRDTGRGSSTTPYVGIHAMSEIVHCPSRVPVDLTIDSTSRFSDLDTCLPESYRRLKLLREQPGWNRLSLSYRCE